MLTDIEIAQQAQLKRIEAIATDNNVDPEILEQYGKYKAKVDFVPNQAQISQGKLILVTATTPNKSGSGKTTTSVALAQGLNYIGKKAIVALREPSLGPCFGMKGGAAGGGYSQVLPMEDINLHFTGDFHAITSANNTIAALLDNYHYNNQGTPNGLNEIMAILCLSTSLEDLRNRIDSILLGYKYDGTPFTMKDLGATGAILILLKDAIKPNLVQTLEGGAAFVHGGPFANIAHGCNSIMATWAALQYGEYAVTEAGFGSDLGAEKFLNIKCRAAGITPAATVLVTTTQSLKLHGGCPEKEIKLPNKEALEKGLLNLERHVNNLQQFGQTVVVALNRFHFDTEDELQMISGWCSAKNAHYAENQGFAKGGEGAADLARKVVEIVEKYPSKPINHTYELTDSVADKLTKIVQKVYGGNAAIMSEAAKKSLKEIDALGANNWPVCIAKTQFSFTDNAKQVGSATNFNITIQKLIVNAGARFVVAVAGDIMRMPGLATNFNITIQKLIVNAGARFVVAVAGDIMRMPGLPKEPAAMGMDVKDGIITGLS